MPRPTIRVRSKVTGDVTEISPGALRHFPDYEPVDAAPEATFVEPPAGAAEPKPSTRRSTAAKTTEEE
jgi:hypothetical protein